MVPERAYKTSGLTLEVMLLPACLLALDLQWETKALAGLFRKAHCNKSNVARNCQHIKYVYCYK